MPQMAQAVSTRPGERKPLWMRIGWQTATLLALVALLYAPILARLVRQWWSDPNFSHGFFVPVFSAFILWQNRARLREAQRKPSAWGLPIIFVSLVMLVVGIFGAEL